MMLYRALTISSQRWCIALCPEKHKQELVSSFRNKKALCSRELLNNHQTNTSETYFPFFLLLFPFPTVPPGLCILSLLLDYSYYAKNEYCASKSFYLKRERIRSYVCIVCAGNNVGRNNTSLNLSLILLDTPPVLSSQTMSEIKIFKYPERDTKLNYKVCLK